MQLDFHYGPMPENNRGREDWTSIYYYRADSIGLGYNRSSTGSDAVHQYFSPLRETFDDVNRCPEKYLLWFHHVSWDYKMKSSNTLWDELCIKYYSGTKYVDGMISQWSPLKPSIDPEIYVHVQTKLETQKTDAAIWLDICFQYFRKFSKKPINISM